MKKILILATFLFVHQFCIAGDLPDKNLTPGVANPQLTRAVICSKSFKTGDYRNVPEAKKLQVFKRYGIDPKSDKWEIDHLIAIEAGGSNAVENLWPQSYTTKPYGAHQKDRLENLIHKKICSGELSLEDGQKALSQNWIESYQRYIIAHLTD